MRTYNQQNTQNVKQSRKQSKELRKLRSNRNTFVETSESVKCQQRSYHYEYDYNAYVGEWL
ncbi:MAG: hypothetical protein RSB94_07220 [Erysipelotrichaceae bacterium]